MIADGAEPQSSRKVRFLSTVTTSSSSLVAPLLRRSEQVRSALYWRRQARQSSESEPLPEPATSTQEAPRKRSSVLNNLWNLRQSFRTSVRSHDDSDPEHGQCRILPRTPFVNYRQQLLTGHRHNLDTAGHYATLRLHVHQAFGLLALDLNGSSDPYVEIYLNDVHQGTSHVVSRNLDPVWEWAVDLEIVSPYSIVRIVVIDKDTLSADDPIGFVEFCVVDLEPGESVTGWMQLRSMDDFESGNAMRRWKKHKEGAQSQAVSEDAVAHIPKELRRLPTSPSLSASAKPQQQAAERGAKSSCLPVARPASLRRPSTMCCKGSQSEKNEEQQVPEATTSVPPEKRSSSVLPGEVRVTMHLDLEMDNFVEQMPSRYMLMFLAVLFPEQLVQKVNCAEWFAFCLRMPEFQDAKDNANDFQMQDLKVFHQDCSDLRDKVLLVFFWPHFNILLLIMSWRYFHLSIGALAYWWFCLWEPQLFICSLPLCVMVCLVVIRDRDSCNALLAHQKCAPLNQAGLDMIARKQNSIAMATWIRRLVKDRGGWVEEMSELRKFAKLTHDVVGEPTLKFDELLSRLHSEDSCPWITWGVTKCKRCEKGHQLEFLGFGAYRPDDGWRCCGVGASDCRRIASLQEEKGLQKKGLHLGVKRYHCPECEKEAPEACDFCGFCAAGGKADGMMALQALNAIPSIWSSVQMKTFKEFVLDMDPYLDLAEDACDLAIRILEALRDPCEKDLEAKIYGGCMVATVVLFSLRSLLGSLFMTCLAWIWTLVAVAAGTGVILFDSAPLRRLRTAYTASRRLEEHRRFRAHDSGGCRSWRFFREEAPTNRTTSQIQDWLLSRKTASVTCASSQ